MVLLTTFTLRPCVPAQDFERVAELYRSFHPEASAERMLEWNRTFPAEGIRLMVCAVDPSGQIMGYGEAVRLPWMKQGKFNIEIVTDPAVRRQGLGTLLHDRAVAFAREHGAAQLTGEVRDNMPECKEWATKQGYSIDRHIFESALSPATFDEARFAGVLDAAVASGIRFFTLADEPGEETERKFFELSRRTVLDIPGWDDEGHPPFEQWRSRLYGPTNRPEWYIFAADGDRLVGLTTLSQTRETGTLYTGYTAVDPEYRGRNIALAVKLLAVRAAQKVGAPFMRTNNDSKNAPMLAVNRKMGYVPEPGMYVLLRDL